MIKLNRKIAKKLLVIYVMIAIILSLNFKFLIELLNLKNYVQLGYYKYVLWDYSIMYGFILAIICIVPFYKYYEIKFTKENSYKVNEDNIKYFREILKDYSISELIKCYGKKILIKDQLVATLLKLKLDNKIEFNNEKINVINEETNYHTEKMLIKQLKGVKVYNKKNLKTCVKEDLEKDCCNSELLNHEKTNDSSIWFKYIDKINLIIWLYNFISFIIISSVLYEETGIIWIILKFISIFIILFFNGLIGGKKIFVTTEKGEEVQEKLIGLKNYLKEYTLIKDKNVEDIMLYEEYIIYAILFNIKGRLNKDSKKIYNEYLSKTM